MKNRMQKHGAAKRTAKTTAKAKAKALSEKFNAMMRKTAAEDRAAQRAAKKDKPEGLKVVFEFDTDFPDEHNTLFMSGTSLYLAEQRREGEYKSFEDCLKVTFLKPEEITFEYLKPISVKEALAWYSRCMPWAMDSSGTMAEVCELAAKQLPARVEDGVSMVVTFSNGSYGILCEAGVALECSPERALHIFVNETDAMVEWSNKDFDENFRVNPS